MDMLPRNFSQEHMKNTNQTGVRTYSVTSMEHLSSSKVVMSALTVQKQSELNLNRISFI